MYQGWRGSLARNLWRVRFSSGPHMKKRYQYWSKDGIVWTNWFNWDGPKFPSPFKKLKVEYNEEL